MILQDTDTGVALLLMAELSEVMDKYGKALYTRECIECVINTMKSELICMMGKDLCGNLKKVFNKHINDPVFNLCSSALVSDKLQFSFTFFLN